MTTDEMKAREAAAEALFRRTWESMPVAAGDAPEWDPMSVGAVDMLRDASAAIDAYLAALSPHPDEETEYGWHTGSEVTWIGDRDQIEAWAAVRGWRVGEGDWGSRIVERQKAGPKAGPWRPARPTPEGSET